MMRIAVTGMGAVSPLGAGVKALWSALLRDASGVSRLDTSWADTFSSRVVASVTLSEESEQGMRGRYSNWHQMSRFQRLGLVATLEAAHHARLDLSSADVDSQRVGVVMGTGFGCMDSLVENATRSFRRRSPYFVPRVLQNLLSTHISLCLACTGPSLGVNSACAASAQAVVDGARLLMCGDADVVLVGGSEACLHPLAFDGFQRLRALSTNFNDEPQSASRPFSDDRDGFVMAEGAGCLVLETMEHATRRMAPIRGELLAYGLSCDASHVTAPSPDGMGAQRAMEICLERSGEVELHYVNAHATSTPRGDEVELAAIARTVEGRFGGRQCAVSSSKGHTGHLLGAAGVVEAIVTLQSLRENLAVGTLNLAPSEEGRRGSVRLLGHGERVACCEAAGKRRVGLSNSFGFGGTNVSLLFAASD